MVAQLHSSTPPPHPVIGFGRLIRVALAPSAISDVLVGIVLGTLASVPSSPLVWLLILASLGVYHGAMALNDWVDREADAKERPDRPIPSGSIPAGGALFIALALLFGGIFWSFGTGPRAGLWYSLVALLAVLYDTAGRGPVRGPLLLGLCRAGNIGAGLFAMWLAGTGAPFQGSLIAVAIVYGAHVFFIARLGRLEDAEDDRPLARRPAEALYGAAATAMAVPVALLVHVFATGLSGLEVWAGLMLSAGVAGWNATVLASAANAGTRAGWTRRAVGIKTGLALRRLPLFALSIALFTVFLGPLGWVAAVFAIVGAKVSGMLRGVFPLT